jgi:hypothetical protein
MSDEVDAASLALEAIKRDPLLVAVFELAVKRERERFVRYEGSITQGSLADIEYASERVMELIRPSSKIAAR